MTVVASSRYLPIVEAEVQHRAPIFMSELPRHNTGGKLVLSEIPELPGIRERLGSISITAGTVPIEEVSFTVFNALRLHQCVGPLFLLDSTLEHGSWLLACDYFINKLDFNWFGLTIFLFVEHFLSNFKF